MPYGTLGNLRGGTRKCHMARSDGKGLIKEGKWDAFLLDARVCVCLTVLGSVF